VSAPTLWEEGRWSGTRVTRLAALCCLVLVVADVALTGGLGPVFAIGFGVVCAGAALAVRPADFFRVGVLPPLLLVGCAVLVSMVARSAVARADDGFVQGVVSALTDNAGALLAGYALALAVLAIRHRVLGRAHSNRVGSPAPYRATSATPEEKSTTVVGDDPASPASITASSR
jgi:hypothetical protein